MTSEPVTMLTTDQWIVGNTFQMIHSKISERYPVHWHEFYEIHFFLDGKGTHIFNGQSYEIKRGSLFLVTPADLHELNPHPDCPFELYNFIFEESFLGNDLYDLLFSQSQHLMTDCDGEAFDAIAYEFSRVKREVHEVRDGSVRVIQGAVERILIDLMRLCPGPSEKGRVQAPSGAYPLIQRALSYINHHFRDKVTLQDVAKQVQLSPNYFSECFHQITGYQFQSYVQGLRLRFARSLLTASELPITDVCYVSGFNTLAHFERVFRQKYGMSPRKYRSQSCLSQQWSETHASL